MLVVLAYLCLSFAQHRVGCTSASQRCASTRGRSWASLGDLCVAAGVIHPTANLYCILPNPILNIFGPCRLELLLADGTRCVPQGSIIRGVYPLFWWAFLGRAAIGSNSIVPCSLVFGVNYIIPNLSGFDPILDLIRITENAG